mgnify:CR=1 FL=1
MIASGYGWRRDPWTGARRFHPGVDLPARRGSPVRAFAQGLVSSVLRHHAAGLTVQITTSDGAHHVYAHLQCAAVRSGDVVHEGQVLGQVGSSGRSTGPHLHFGVQIQGRWVDPTHFVRRRAHLHPQRGSYHVR